MRPLIPIVIPAVSFLLVASVVLDPQGAAFAAGQEAAANATTAGAGPVAQAQSAPTIGQPLEAGVLDALRGGESVAVVSVKDDGEVSGNHAENLRSEEHTSELQSLMRISYAVFCLKKKHKHNTTPKRRELN